MKSKTKYELNHNQLLAIFEKANLGHLDSYSPITYGEYNSIYDLVSGENHYVLKIAPTADARIMTYEKGMISAEVFWYEQLAKNTSIRVPRIIFSDFSKEIVPSDYVIMEKIEGNSLNAVKLFPHEVNLLTEKQVEIIASMHEVAGTKFGYVQNKLFTNWYDALQSFIVNCLDDCRKMGKQSKRGEKLLQLVHSNKKLLKQVPSHLVNFDLWAGNLMCKDRDLNDIALIDPERSFWGDKIFDFVAVDMIKMSFDMKKPFLDIYNKTSSQPLEVTAETQIRFAFGLGYLALIMETEKYYRYNIFRFGWWRNVIATKLLYGSCFRILYEAVKN